jgi:hypothetical protein
LQGGGLESNPVPSLRSSATKDRFSASAAIPPCVVLVRNELISCRSAVNQLERQLLDWANANSRP